jgi:hypothetical protein
LRSRRRTEKKEKIAKKKRRKVDAAVEAGREDEEQASGNKFLYQRYLGKRCIQSIFGSGVFTLKLLT